MEILRKRKCLTVLFILLISCMSLNFSSVVKVEAADGKSWTEDVPDEIYQSNDPESTPVVAEEKKPNTFEKIIMGGLNSLSGVLDTWTKKLHIDLNSIIFGRVGGGGLSVQSGSKVIRIALFTFELKEGNPYGIIASAVYTIIRGIIYIVLICMVFAKVIALSFAGNSSKAREALKSSINSGVLSVALLAIMPYFVDLFLYVRDTILYAVGIKGAQDLLGLTGTASMVDFFAAAADKNLMNSFMYFGTFLLSFWFVLQYAGVALSYVVSFIAFPFICLNAQFDKNALGTWVKNVYSNALIPIADCALLLIPATLGLFASSVPEIAVVQLIICTMIIPTRAVLRHYMGLNSNMGLEVAGLAAMMGATNMLRSAVGTSVGAVRGGVQGLRESRSDRQMAKYHESLAGAEIDAGNDYADAINGENGYGSSEGVVSSSGGMELVGSKEVAGVNSQAVAAAGMENLYGVPSSAILDGVDSNYSSNANMGSSIGSSYNSRNAGNRDLSDRQNAIREKFANVHNFDNPEFNNISNQRKAELYRERARMKRNSAISTSVGRLGGAAAGATLGLAAGTFFSPGAKATMMGMGVMAGGAAGGAAGDLVGKAGMSLGDKVSSAVERKREGMQLDQFVKNYANTFNGTEEIAPGIQIGNEVTDLQAASSGNIVGYESARGHNDIGAYVNNLELEAVQDKGSYSNDIPKFQPNSVGAPAVNVQEFASSNSSTIMNAHRQAAKFYDTPEQSAQIKVIYDRVKAEPSVGSEYIDRDRKNKRFMSEVSNHINENFEKKFTESKDVKWTGNNEADQKLKQGVIEIHKEIIDKPQYQDNLKKILDGLGYTF